MWGKRAVGALACIESCGEAAATETLECDWLGQLVGIGNFAQRHSYRRACRALAPSRHGHNLRQGASLKQLDKFRSENILGSGNVRELVTANHDLG
jgi:hypothetical protein